MSRVSMPSDINVYRTGKNFSPDIFRNFGHAGVLTIEALAQARAVAILSMEENKGKTAYFGGIRDCRFPRKGCPGR